MSDKKLTIKELQELKAKKANKVNSNEIINKDDN
tara:strand:- start:13385 stop:13486 length:102 start_codon:yes stop_codon:yes gene_type:complete